MKIGNNINLNDDERIFGELLYSHKYINKQLRVHIIQSGVHRLCVKTAMNIYETVIKNLS